MDKSNPTPFTQGDTEKCRDIEQTFRYFINMSKQKANA